MGGQRTVVTSTRRVRQNIFTFLLNTSNELYCRFRPDTTLTYINDTYCNAFSMSRCQLLGKKFLDLVPQENHQAIKDHLSNLSSTNPSMYYDHTAIDCNGSLVWQSWEDHAIFDKNNNIVEIESVGYDYIKQEEKDGKLTLLNDKSNYPEIVFETDTLNIVCANDKAAELYACDKSYLISTSMLDWSMLSSQQINEIKSTPDFIEQFSYNTQHRTCNNYLIDFKLYATAIHTSEQKFTHAKFTNISPSYIPGISAANPNYVTS